MDLITGSVRDALGPGVRVRLRSRPAEPVESPRSIPRSHGPPDHPGPGAVGPALPRPLHRSTRSSRARATSSPTRPRWPSPRRRPRRAYNPLFIYGGVGLGKTHLLFAIGHHMTRLTPRTRVRYVTSRELHDRVHQGRPRAPRLPVPAAVPRRRRPAPRRHPVPRAREETQTEFFHTFNHLHQRERQIVIASRPAAAGAGRDRGAAAQPVPLGPLRRRAAARPRDADRDPAAQGRARPARRARTTCQHFIALEVRLRTSASSRARCCASPRSPRSPASRSTSRSPSARCEDLIPRVRPRDPAAADPGGDRVVLRPRAGGPGVEEPLAAADDRTTRRDVPAARAAPGLSLIKIGESSTATTRPPCTGSRRSRPSCRRAAAPTGRSRT